VRKITNALYINKLNLCPICGASGVIASGNISMKQENKVMHCEMECQSCSSFYIEVFRLSGYKLIENRKQGKKS
jgi:C4-type Zn-finger protein